MNTTNKNKLLILIPAFNEEKNINNVIKNTKLELLNLNLNNTEILIIDDASTDNTISIVSKYNVKCIKNFSHIGYGSTLQVGYRYAIKHNFDYIIQIDGDNQHDPKNIKYIYKELTSNKKPDIVLGSRFLPKSKCYKIPMLKKFAIKYFCQLFKMSTGKKLSDPTTGLQGLSKNIIEYYSNFNQFDNKYPDSNVLLDAANHGFTFSEIPAIVHDRKDGKSMHNGLEPIYYMLHMTLSVIFAQSIRQKAYDNEQK